MLHRCVHSHTCWRCLTAEHALQQASCVTAALLLLPAGLRPPGGPLFPIGQQGPPSGGALGSSGPAGPSSGGPAQQPLFPVMGAVAGGPGPGPAALAAAAPAAEPPAAAAQAADGVPPLQPPAQVGDVQLVWSDEQYSMEERRAMLPKYAAARARGAMRLAPDGAAGAAAGMHGAPIGIVRPPNVVLG